MQDLLQRVKASEIIIKTHDERLRNLENMQNQLAEMNATTRLLAQSMKSVENKVIEIDERFSDHELEPAGNWKKLMWLIGGAIVGAIMALVINQIGLGG